MENDEEELIRRRAYAIWEQEGRPDGQHLRHWERASQESRSSAPNGDSLAHAGASQTPPQPRRRSTRNGARGQ